MTALANTGPMVGVQRKETQGLQWFLSELCWNPEEMNRRRVSETGDRKNGTATAHVGKQYLGGIGKIDNGVVCVSSLWVDERLYYPTEVESYTPARHFKGGKAAPEFRTKPQKLFGWSSELLPWAFPSGRWLGTSSTESIGCSRKDSRTGKYPIFYP